VNWRTGYTASMVNRILIVCVGNICRSPTAEVMLRDRLREKGTLVESAGLAALVGQPIDPTAESVLGRNGLTAVGHVARQLSQAMLSAADMVLAMDNRHVSAIQALAPQVRGKTFFLGRWQDDRPIPDPYGRDLTEFERTFGMIADAVDAWTTRL
jgi:protein-tyrosine phosphatase